MTTLLTNKNLTIVVISSLNTYSTAGYLISALKNSGHSVFVVSDTPHSFVNTRVNGVFNLADLLRKSKVNPDLIFFIEGGSMRLFPVGLEDISCLSAWYGIDTHMNYEKHLCISRLFDITFVAQKEFVGRLIVDGIKQVSWLPLASEPTIYPKQLLERKYDISYVGSNDAVMHPERHQMLSAIQKQYSNIWIGKASPSEMGRIYSDSKMIFNRSINNDVNMRIFEAMGAGAVLLTNEISNNGLEDLFPVDQPYVVYTDEADLLRLIGELLNDPERLKKIGSAAKSLIEKQHTYSHRANELIYIINGGAVKQKILSEFVISALLTQGFIGGATLEIAKLFKQSSLTGSARWSSNFGSALIKILGCVIIYFERIKIFLRK